MGYDDKRFDTRVNDEFHCLICKNVLREPVMCRNQHYFCRCCITKHLHPNRRTCPMCADELTVDTLSEVPRVVKNVLGGLMICCDHYNRGCRELIQLQNLKRHADNCGFQPVLCGNKGCDERINERDRIYHEYAVCEFRRSKCNNCESTNMAIEGVERKIKNIETNMSATQTKTANVEAKVENLATESTDINTKVETVETKTAATAMSERNMGGKLENLEKITTATDTKLADLKRNLENLQEEIRNTDTKAKDMGKNLAKIKGKVQNMETSTININKNLEEIGTKIENIETQRASTDKKMKILIFVIFQVFFMIYVMKFSNVKPLVPILCMLPFIIVFYRFSL